VIDAPGGGGKIPLLPNYVLHKDEEKIVLRNFKHKIYTYKNYHDRNNPELPIDLTVEVTANKSKTKNLKTVKTKLPRMEKVKN
jgi:lysine 2,3-aminomutase